jgi:YD repeat-containing protein
VATTSTYDYGNLTTPVRSYSNTYLYQNGTTGATYQGRYIYDRLATRTLTSAAPNVTLVQNAYDGGTLNTTATLPNEWDIVNYPASFIYRGNVTQANSPGKTTNTTYDYTGTVVSQNDNNGHSVNVATSTATNYTLPDTLSPNGSSTLQTQAQYTTTGYFPGSVAGPNQSIYNPTSAPNGTAAYTEYDNYGRLYYSQPPSQVAGQAATAWTDYSYGYASTGWTIKATTVNGSGPTPFTTTILDGLGRTASVQTGSGSGVTVLSEVDTLYAPCACSPLGKMYQQTQPYTPPNSAPPATTYTYDALGRTVSVLLPDGASQTTYAYQGNFTTVTDPAGNWKQYATDALGNLVMVLEPDPTHNPVVGPPTPSTYPVTSAPTGTLLTTYTYDQFNHLTQVSMPRTTGYGLVTQTRTFVYASTTYSTLTLPAVWLTSTTNPESGTVSYTYNADGTLASKKDANGNTETYTYDAYQRLTGIPDRGQSFTYDTCPLGITVCANAPGQLTEAAFASGLGANQLSFQYYYTYTPAGKVASKSLMVESANHLGATGTLTATYGYDGLGTLTSQQYPISQTWASGTSNTFTYTLDPLERPIQMTDSTQKTWAFGVNESGSSARCSHSPPPSG